MNMHISPLHVVLTLALLGSSSAASAAIAPQDLEVRGTLRTPSCTVMPENNGVYDYGKINKSNIPLTGHLALSRLTQQWVVDCGTGVTFLSFQVVDNVAASASISANDKFGLGEVPGHAGSKIGHYTVTLGDAFVDNTVASVLQAAPGALSGTAAATRPLDKTQSHSWATTAGTGKTPAQGSRFSMGLTVQGHIASAGLMLAPVTDGVPLDGSMTLSYSFGL